MHYSIQQDLVRGHHEALLREAGRAHLAAIARQGRATESTAGRLDRLGVLVHRLRLRRVRPVAAH
jgi:hypothetical protein